MKLQNGATYQHVKIDQQMEMLKQRQVIAVLKFRTKLYVVTRDQHGHDELLAYCFDDDNEQLQLYEFAKQCYNDYLLEVKQC